MIRAPLAPWILLVSAAAGHGCGAAQPSGGGGPALSYDGVSDPPPERGQARAGASCVSARTPSVTRFARLTPRQYDNSVRDLTGLDLGLAQDFLPDQAQAGFDRGVDLQVGDALGQAYRLAAEQLA